MKILLTGGAGYIGSHTYLELCASGHIPVIIDNFENSSPQVIDRLEEITGAAPLFHKADVRDTATVRHIIADEGCEAVVHFAGLKSVAESVEKPLALSLIHI